MSARPGWLSDDGLSAMRSARWSSDRAQVRWTPEFQKVWSMTKPDPWFEYRQGGGELMGWITKNGHRALAAIELEEMEANPLLRNFAPQAPVAGWTKDWPTQPGWYWMFWDDRSPGFEYRRKVRPVLIGDDISDGRPSGELSFHPMAQPPEPPKDTP